MKHSQAVRPKERPRIVVSKFGGVNRQAIDWILETVRECYQRLKPHEVALMDLYIFERSSTTNAFMKKESREVGVVSASFDELFFAMHDAYRGVSRITICLERMKRLPELVQVGGIRHEVGHSVLHGNLLYYLIPLSPALLDMISDFKVSREYAVNLLYLISIAVKDYEVTRLLHERGYIEDQISYVKHLLEDVESDKFSWLMAEGKPLAEIVCLAACLEAAGCITPFLLNERADSGLNKLFEMSLSFLPTDFSTLILDVILNGFSPLGKDTLGNINQLSRLFIDEVAGPLITRRFRGQAQSL